MNRRIPLTYLGLPLLYAGILLLLLYIQFSGGSLFSDSVGPIQLEGVFELAEDDRAPAIDTLTIGVEGLEFVFDDRNPIALTQQQDAQQYYDLQGYQSIPGGFRILFEAGIELEITYEGEGDQFILNPIIPESEQPYRGVLVPYRLQRGADARITENYPGLEVGYNGDQYILSLPPRSFIQTDTQTMVFAADTASLMARYTRRAAGNQDVFELWFQDQVPQVSTSAYSAGIQEYIDAAYLGWRTNRFNAGTGMWSHRNGDSAFNEEILISLLAEAWQRNDYTRVYTSMRTAADAHPDALTYRSSVFLGDLRRVTAGLEAHTEALRTRIANLVTQRNMEVFLVPELFSFAAFHGGNDLYADLKNLTDTINTVALEPSQAVGLLANLLIFDLPATEIAQFREAFYPLIEEMVLPNIIRIDQGFFFQSEPGIAESQLNVLAGKMLQAAGRELNDDRLVNLGRTMVLSILNLGDSQGFLPERIEITGGEISAFLRFRGPEDIYSLIQQNPFYPRMESLYPYFGPGSWWYTIAQVDDIQFSGNQLTLSATTTRNRTQYMLIHGIPRVDPLTGMQLFGITWRNAPDFEVYSKGRYYNPDSQTLMIKYYDDDPDEDIVIWF